jgi:hypothetical protein
MGGGYDDERDVDLARHRRDAGVRDDAVDHGGLGIHRIHGTVEPGHQQVVEEAATDR